MLREAAEVQTASLCPLCLVRIPAERRMEGNEVVLVKNCPSHGEFRTVIWRGEPSISGWSRPKEPFHAETCQTESERGCPFDCGICPGHMQQSCAILLEITARCNLSCPYCFADAGQRNEPDLPLNAIIERYRTIHRTCGTHNIIQLSGGEPTVRNDLSEIVAAGRDLGFPFIQLNSNGVRLAAEPGYAGELASAGLFSVFLQFDGTEEQIYQSIRGRPLFREKLKAIEHCVANGLGVVLVPTIVAGINSDNLGAILKLALELAPGVRGVHFQPVAYFGRYPGSNLPDDRHTLPDLMRAIEAQTDGMMKTEHFRPPGSEHPHCSFHANFLVQPGGGLKALTGHAPICCGESREAENRGTGRAVSFVANQWGAPARSASGNEPESLDAFLENFRANTFAVSAMAFQDVWSLDLERVRECCIRVAALDGRMIPFCLYNLTSAEGIPLYRSWG